MDVRTDVKPDVVVFPADVDFVAALNYDFTNLTDIAARLAMPLTPADVRSRLVEFVREGGGLVEQRGESWPDQA